MSDESEEAEQTGDEETETGGDEEQSFRERVEEIRQKRAEEGDEEGEVRSPAESMMGGGGGGMGGNPFAEMMGGMMGGGPPGMGGGPRGEQGEGNEELVREVRKLRDEVHDLRRSVDRIADALEE
jgi:hypothetical protein